MTLMAHMVTKFEDIDFEERRHRDAIIARWAHSYDRSGGLTTERARRLTHNFDTRMRADHDRFLDALTTDDVQWMSPRLSEDHNDWLTTEIVEAIRRDRHSAHPTDRIGWIETSAGPLAWAVKRPDSWSELFQTLRSGRSISLYVWHPDDLKAEQTGITKRTR